MSLEQEKLDSEYYNRAATVVRRTIKAGTVEPIDAYGAAYHLISATGNRSVFISTDTSSEVPVAVSATQNFPQYFRFRSLLVRNPAPFDVEVVIWYGFGSYTPHNFSLSESPTRIIGTPLAGGVIAGLGTVSLTGAPSGSLAVRKCVIVSNDDPSNKLEIRDGSGVPCVRVYPFTSVKVETSDSVSVHNPNGSAVAACVSEVWYLANS